MANELRAYSEEEIYWKKNQRRSLGKTKHCICWVSRESQRVEEVVSNCLLCITSQTSRFGLPGADFFPIIAGMTTASVFDSG